ncbi:hypothetical protein D9M72_641870 [compost metagenome]
MPAIGAGLAAEERIGLLFRLEQARGDFEEAFAMGAEADAARLSIKQVLAAIRLQLPHVLR